MLHLFAKASGLNPGELTINFGDVHIYNNHINQVKEQLRRKPYYFPRLDIDVDINTLEDIENLEYKNFKVMDYHYHPAIKAPMAV